MAGALICGDGNVVQQSCHGLGSPNEDAVNQLEGHLVWAQLRPALHA